MNLDREIAEKVMGWTGVVWNPSGHWMGSPKGGGWKQIPKYSKSIARAMEVEAEMFRRGLTIVIVRQDNGSFDVAFEYEGMDGNWLNSKSLQEAICRAALAALEVK